MALQGNSPPGTTNGQHVLYKLLGRNVLENIAKLGEECVLSGQPQPQRSCARKSFIQIPEFYGISNPGRALGHLHGWSEIAAVVEGELDVIIGEATYRARVGDWLVVTPNVPHGECCVQQKNEYRVVWFEMDRPFPNLHVTEYRRATGYSSFGIFGLPSLPPYLRSVTSHLFTAQWPPENQARMDLLRLVMWIMELLEQSMRAKSSKASQKILEVKNLITESDQAYPSVREIAEQVGLTANYLSTLFHAETGITIRDYIATRRIEEAKGMLENPGVSVKEVAHQLGFQNPYHFSHVFHRITGLRPSAYRTFLLEAGPSHLLRRRGEIDNPSENGTW